MRFQTQRPDHVNNHKCRQPFHSSREHRKQIEKDTMQTLQTTKAARKLMRLFKQNPSETTDMEAMQKKPNILTRKVNKDQQQQTEAKKEQISETNFEIAQTTISDDPVMSLPVVSQGNKSAMTVQEMTP